MNHTDAGVCYVPLSMLVLTIITFLAQQALGERIVEIAHTEGVPGVRPGCGDPADPCAVFMHSGFSASADAGRCLAIRTPSGEIHAMIVSGDVGSPDLEGYSVASPAWKKLTVNEPDAEGPILAILEAKDCTVEVSCSVPQEGGPPADCGATPGSPCRVAVAAGTSLLGSSFRLSLPDSGELYARADVTLEADDDRRMHVSPFVFDKLSRRGDGDGLCPSEPRSITATVTVDGFAVAPPAVDNPIGTWTAKSLSGEVIETHVIFTHQDSDWIFSARYTTLASSHSSPNDFFICYTARISDNHRPKVLHLKMLEDFTVEVQSMLFVDPRPTLTGVPGDDAYLFSIGIDENDYVIVAGNMNEYPYYMEERHDHLPQDARNHHCLLWGRSYAGNPPASSFGFLGDDAAKCPPPEDTSG
eukprot:Polyplicarium_translucidae@DN3110_c0_g1_i6.p2